MSAQGERGTMRTIRGSGFLLPISSLPSRYGIGTFGKAAFWFVDQLARARQSYWQVLPIGPVGFGDSPYQPLSVFANNPYYIDPEILIDRGWLTRRECDALDFGSDPTSVDYGKLYENRYLLLQKAFARFEEQADPELLKSFAAYRQKNAFWLADYALYRAIKTEQGGGAWSGWPKALRQREQGALLAARERLLESVTFHEFLQWEADRQWQSLRRYANEHGISIIGLAPFYVGADSADAWAGREGLQLDPATCRQEVVAGAAPDETFRKGQVWGDPLYNWAEHARTDFSWWLRRLERDFDRFDVIRIDHFRAFAASYAVPAGAEDGSHGTWQKGPGMAIFRAFRRAFPEGKIIAEDRNVPDSVRELVRESGYPGIRVLEAAFDAREADPAINLPENYPVNCVVYTSTHDNETVNGWYANALEDLDRDAVREYFGDYTLGDRQMNLLMIRVAMESRARVCIIPIQDLLGLDDSARINTPSTTGGDNWRWRMTRDQLTPELLDGAASLTKKAGRTR